MNQKVRKHDANDAIEYTDVILLCSRKKLLQSL